MFVASCFCNVFRKYPLPHSALFRMKMIKENYMFSSIFKKFALKFAYIEYMYLYMQNIHVLLPIVLFLYMYQFINIVKGSCFVRSANLLL